MSTLPLRYIKARKIRVPGWRLGRRFRKTEDGATAVEFGLVAMPFFALLFAIVETALTFWSSQVLETAVANASRQIYTGTFQSSSGNSVATTALINFKANVCANVAALFNCPQLVSVDIQKFTTFSASTITVPIDASGNYNTSSYGYNPPGPNEIGVVRASMEYPRFVSIVGPSTALRNGKRLIMASSTFRTEPYQ